MNGLCRRAARVSLCLVALGMHTAQASAQGAGVLLLQAMLSLAVVIAIIYATYFGLRRLGDRRLGADTEGPLRVLQARSLGGDRWLYLVAVGSRRLLVGGAAGQVTPIADLGDTGAEGEATDERAL